MFILFAVAAIISGPVYHSRDGLSFKEDPSLRAVTNEFPKVGRLDGAEIGSGSKMGKLQVVMGLTIWMR